MFSNPFRLRLVFTLGTGRRTVSSLAEAMDLPVSSTSRHLGKLRDKGVVRAEREGNADGKGGGGAVRASSARRARATTPITR